MLVIRQFFAGILLVAGFASLASASAAAATINYTVSGAANGRLTDLNTLKHTYFSDEVIVLTSIGDTANIQDKGGGLFTNAISAGQTKITILGNTYTLFHPTFVYNDQSQKTAGIAVVTQSNTILGTVHNGLSAYALATDIGPLLGASFFLGSIHLVDDSWTSFTLTAVGSTAFSASLEPVETPAETPIPPMFLLSLAGFAGLGYAARHRTTPATH